MTFSYATIEAALAQTNDIAPNLMSAFRARITNLRRFGVTPPAPRKGAPIRWTFGDVAKLALALEFAQIGMDPAAIARFVAHVWPIAAPESVRPPNGILVFSPSFLSDPTGWPASAEMTDESYLCRHFSGGWRHLAMVDVEALYESLRAALDDGVRDAA